MVNDTLFYNKIIWFIFPTLDSTVQNPTLHSGKNLYTLYVEVLHSSREDGYSNDGISDWGKEVWEGGRKGEGNKQIKFQEERTDKYRN